MFPLAGKNFPDSGETLASAISGALAQVLTMPTKNSAVAVEGGKFPKVKKLSIDLSGASVSAAEPPPKPKATGKREPGIEVDQLEVLGQPIKYEQNKLDLSLNARGVRFDYGRDKKGQPLLVLADAKDGHVEAMISKADIESLARAAAEMAAKQHGIKIEGLELTLTSDTFWAVPSVRGWNDAVAEAPSAALSRILLARKKSLTIFSSG